MSRILTQKGRVILTENERSWYNYELENNQKSLRDNKERLHQLEQFSKNDPSYAAEERAMYERRISRIEARNDELRERLELNSRPPEDAMEEQNLKQLDQAEATILSDMKQMEKMYEMNKEKREGQQISQNDSDLKFSVLKDTPENKNLQNESSNDNGENHSASSSNEETPSSGMSNK